MLDKRLYKDVYDEIQEHLYSYLYVDKQIAEIKEKYQTNTSDINYWIKSKGKINRTVENKAIANIEMYEEIEQELQWYEIISRMLDIYKENKQEQKIRYIELRYFQNKSDDRIKQIMYIGRNTQIRIRYEILDYILLKAVEQHLIKIDF